MPRLDSHRAIRWLLLAALFVGLVVCALLPALLAGPLFSARYDWRYFESMAEMSRRTMVFYHQAPLWNPYSCGGEVDLANPQSMGGAPTFLFVLAFGTAWGFKLSMALYYLLGLGGMYKLGRRLGLDVGPALCSAICFGLSGYLALHLAAGHMNFASVALLPLLIYCFDRAIEDWFWVLPTSALAGWVAVYGGTFTPALTGELLFLWATTVAWRPLKQAPTMGVPMRLVWAYGLLLLCGVVALLLSAYRMLPALEFILDHPRPLFRRTPDMTTIRQVVRDLFAARDLGPLPGRKYWSHEYTAKLPLLAAPLALLAIGAAIVKKARWQLVLGFSALGFCALLLSLGNFSPVSPWSLLQRLPVLRDLRVPSRHLVLVVFFVALLAGIGAQQVADFLSPRSTRVAMAAIALLILGSAIDGAYYTAKQFRDVFTASLPIPTSQPLFFHVESHWSQMRELLFAGRGALGCDEEAPLQRAEALDAGNVPQARLLDPTAGEVVEHRFSPNVRTIRLDLKRTDTLLLINSNWNEHFHVSPAPARITRVSGRLAVDLHGLSAGPQTLEVSYAPRSFRIGVFVSALSLLIALALIAERLIRRRAYR